MLSVPYSATIIAHERMSVFAVISILEAVLRLVGVMLIPFIKSDALILYGVVVALVALVTMGMNMGYILQKMPEYRTGPSWEKELSTRILAFSGWTMLGSATYTGTQQGVALLFNNFVSLIANAALGFANQVNAALAQFVNSFTTAFNPQVIKLCAAKDYDALHRLMTMASKISFVLAYIMALPLIVNMDYLLHLWLGNVPQYTTEFCQLILVCTVIDATTGVYNTAITATGQIRNYQIAISLSFTLDLLLAFLLLKAQIHPALVFGSRILTRGLINMGIGLYYTRSLIAFDIKRYTLQALVPIMLVLIITIPVNYGLRYYFDALPLLLVSTTVDCILIAALGYIIVLNASERTTLMNTIKQKLHVA
jgi:O-antigen/teichoic acid export membrane protein